MTGSEPDRDLRERFAALRAAEEERAPGYRAVRARAPRPARPVLPRVAAALAVPTALVALWLVTVDAPPVEPPPAPPSATAARADGGPGFGPEAWRMPSDALLELPGLPGHALLRELPRLVTPPATGAPTSGARSWRSAVRRTVS